VGYLLFVMFGLNYVFYAVLSLVFHVVASVAVFYLADELFEDRKLALASALLFAAFAAGYQATSWVFIDVATHGAAIFGLVSAVYFIRALKGGGNRLFVISVASLMLSLLFKEVVLGLFIFFPLTCLIFPKKGGRKCVFGMFLMAALYFSFRLLMLYLLPSSGAATVLSEARYATGEYYYDLLFIPMRAVAQTFVPLAALKALSKFVYSGKLWEVEEVNVLVFVFSVALFLAAWVRQKGGKGAKVALFGLGWMVTNSLIFSFALERSGKMIVVDSRYLYFVAVGAVIFLVQILRIFLGRSRVFYGAVVVVLVFNVFWLNWELVNYYQVARERKAILRTIGEAYASLPAKVTVYTESDSSFYGLPAEERILPFQSGFGQTLLVYYAQHESFAEEFLKDRFLWGITDEGYMEAGDRGFGYFRDFDKLAEEVSRNKLGGENVIAFSYDSEEKGVSDITTQVRGRLEGYSAEKRLIPQGGYKMTASVNEEGISWANDGRRETFWNSGVQYMFAQDVEVEFDRERVVAQIRIDSYDNKDQNMVGYRVLISDNGESWNEIFYAKRYPPEEDGLVDIYFGPQKARMIRIEQVGYHQYATWVIHEISIYEAVNR